MADVKSAIDAVVQIPFRNQSYETENANLKAFKLLCRKNENIKPIFDYLVRVCLLRSDAWVRYEPGKNEKEIYKYLAR